VAIGLGRKVTDPASLGSWGRFISDSTLCWLDEADGILLVIPRTGNDVLRVDLATAAIEHLERLYRVNVDEFLHVKMWPEPDGTAVLHYDRGTVKLAADARVRSHQVINDFADVARRWDPAELPALGGPPAAERVFRAEATGRRQPASIVIELTTMPRGLVWYGLLGAVYTWAPADSLTVTVLVDGGQPLADNLAYAPRRPSGKATFGLPEDCVASVMRGFGAGAAKFADLPGGSLRFEYAAYGNVGPSAEVFHGLAAAVTQLLLGSPKPWYVALCDELGLQHQYRTN
jgi:hypothetical protein